MQVQMCYHSIIVRFFFISASYSIDLISPTFETENISSIQFAMQSKSIKFHLGAPEKKLMRFEI